MLGFYLLTTLSSVYIQGCNGATLGQTCNEIDSCTDTYQVCNTICVCDTGYYDTTRTSDIGGKCVLKISIGSSCPFNFESSSVPCIDDNARCTYTNTGYKCICIDGYYNKNGICSPKEQLGAGCTLTTDCADGNAECSSQKCTCKSGYYDNTGTSDTGGTCIAMKTLGLSCPNPTNTGVMSTDSCIDSNALCQRSGSTYICSCRSTYYDDNGANVLGGNCEIKIQLGAECPVPSNAVPNTATCFDKIATCISDGTNYKCLCPSDYYDSDGVNTVGGQCLSKKQLGDNCQYNRECRDSNSECSGSGKCYCKSGYYDNDGTFYMGGTCTAKVELGSVCPMAYACINANSECVANVCVCTYTHYDNNTDSVSGGDCKNLKRLNTPCSETDLNNYNPDQCSEPFATCINNSCTCLPGYNQEGLGCVANKANGESCIGDTVDECSDPNSECRNNICTCTTSFYDDNGLDVGGKCQPVSDMQVGSVTFNDIQITSFTVLWSHPSVVPSYYLYYYTVRWTVIDEVNDGRSYTLSSRMSTYTITSLTPGKAYKVEILTLNSKTEENIERVTNVSKQQAAKPLKVEAILSGGDHHDVERSGLTIRYNPVNGGSSGYNVRLFDGDEKIAEKDPGQGITSVIIYNSNLPNNYGILKNGYNYTVKIKAKSELYDNGYVVESDVFEAIIKTTPKKPNPPEYGQCDNVLDNAITVSWNPPSVPNGYIIRYHVQFYLSSVYTTRSTVNDVTSLKVDGLDPGTSYNFELITENEVGNSSTSSLISSDCKTKAKMADAPQSLRISNTSSLGLIVTWNKPVILFSEENFGYVLQIRDDTDTCVTRVLYKCTDCDFGLFKFSTLPNPCTGISQSTKMKTKDQLLQPLSYTAVLKPATLYTVTVAAINGAGQGYIALSNKITQEEAPQKPSLSTSGITSRNVTLDWTIVGPRPSVIFFDIKVVTNQPATSVEKTIEGFDKWTFKVTGLEEFWDYNISVVARTPEGSVESNIVSIQTLPAAPGRVSNFVVTKRPGGIYTQIKVTWKAPTILERNSVIKEYHLMHNTTQNNEWTTDVYRQQDNMNYVYDSLLTVVPEMYYLIQVTAVNKDDVIGEVSEVLTFTPAGIPPNNVEQSHDIIYYQHDVTQTSFSVDLYKEFFQQNEHGMIRATGLIGCITDKCNFNYRMSLSEFNSMTSWTISSQNGYTTYRITKHDWLENVTRKKRQTSVNIIKFAIGVDDCVNIPDDVYCNGPLAPGSSYTIVAVACTNGGCLLSESYGPFETSKEFSCGYDLIAVIVGVVMGVIIIVLLFYSSFVTLRLRRLSKRDQTKQPDAQQQPQYVNQMFLDVVSQSPDVENIPSPEDNYTSLNEETREDKSTYETF